MFIDLPRARPSALAAFVTLSVVAGAAHATENSQVRALLGAPSYEISTPQFPGVYLQTWYQHYEADKLRDADGNTPTRSLTIPGVGALPLTVNGSIKADVFVPRLTWVTEKIVMDGRLGFSAAFPLVKQTNDFTLTTVLPAGLPATAVAQINQQLSAAGGALSGTRSGMADPELAAYIDWQQDESRVALGVAFNPPMGSYDASRAVNPGAGKYWTFKPLLVASRVWENGFAVGLRATYSFNTRNDDTGVRSGQYLHADWSGTYNVNDQWKVGVQGYVLKQFTADNGGAAGANKVQALSAGPLIAYLAESGEWGVDFKVMKEFSVRNRPEGTVTWLRLNYRLN
ncbi:SphA family protein [Roseateles sp. L2-2]|uniref:SphA family protein n=1 Tax=Roseateles TaxID=93681 RepID=UPI003D35E9C7